MVSSLAIITRIEGDRVYVWTKGNPLQELCFPVEHGPEQLKPGIFVRYIQVRPPDEVQYGGALSLPPPEQIPRKTSVVFGANPEEFRVSAHIGFSPPGSAYFVKEVAQAEDYNIQFYCHSVEFGTVVSFHNIDYHWDKKYKVMVGRFPHNLDWMIPKVGTMWAVSKEQFVEITDPMELQRVSSHMPWNSEMCTELRMASNVNNNPVLDHYGNGTSTNVDQIMEADLLGIGNLPNTSAQANRVMPSVELSPFHLHSSLVPPNHTLFDQLAISPPNNIGIGTSGASSASTKLGHSSAMTNLYGQKLWNADINDFGDSINGSLMKRKQQEDFVPEFEYGRQRQKFEDETVTLMADISRQKGGTSNELDWDEQTEDASEEEATRRGSNSFDEIEHYVASVLSELKSKKNHEEAIELEQKIMAMCVMMHSDVA